MTILIFLNSEPGFAMDIKTLYNIMMIAFLSDLLSLLMFKSKVKNMKEMYIRLSLNFILFEIIMITAAGMIGWIKGIFQSVIYTLIIAAIFLIIRFISWMDDKKVTEEINEKLKEMKKYNTGEEE
jgi:ABC-type transport system involved in cytochrome bd biosynthesis fused ATPase/permease subunit